MDKVTFPTASTRCQLSLIYECFTAKAKHMIMLGHRQVKKHTAIFPAKDRSHKKQKYRYNSSLIFDDLHQMTLIGHHVTQMFVLFPLPVTHWIHVWKFPLATDLSLEVVFLPHFSEYKPETISKDIF